jgi:large subunit ribosomal protein L27
MGKDHTIFALKDGKVQFKTRGPKGKTHVDILAA